MALITKSLTFPPLPCVGCFKPLNRWNRYIYHNRKCLIKWNKLLDNFAFTTEDIMVKKVKGGKGGKKGGY